MGNYLGPTVSAEELDKSLAPKFWPDAPAPAEPITESSAELVFDESAELVSGRSDPNLWCGPPELKAPARVAEPKSSLLADLQREQRAIERAKSTLDTLVKGRLRAVLRDLDELSGFVENSNDKSLVLQAVGCLRTAIADDITKAA